jgi:hypothetical protein
MLHKVYDIELPYEELGLKTPEKKATITTYIKEMYPDYQDPFKTTCYNMSWWRI